MTKLEPKRIHPARALRTIWTTNSRALRMAKNAQGMILTKKKSTKVKEQL